MIAKGLAQEGPKREPVGKGFRFLLLNTDINAAGLLRSQLLKGCTSFLSGEGIVHFRLNVEDSFLQSDGLYAEVGISVHCDGNPFASDIRDLAVFSTIYDNKRIESVVSQHNENFHQACDAWKLQAIRFQ